VRKIYWCDLETTGLDHYKESILEIAVCEADFLDPFNYKVIHQSVMWFHPDLIKDLDPVVQKMHATNGLWKETGDEEKALDLWEAEKQLLDLIPMIEDREEKPVLAGSCIDFDRRFIEHHMPKLAKRFVHRPYDISALKLYCQSRGMPLIPKGEAHRALDDIKESIAHAQLCEAWLTQNLPLRLPRP